MSEEKSNVSPRDKITIRCVRNTTPCVSNARVLRNLIYLKRNWKYRTNRTLSNANECTDGETMSYDGTNGGGASSQPFSSSFLANSNTEFLGAFAYESERNSQITRVVLPAYEYCSISMLNHAKFGRSIYDQLTDKGGTVKNVLQSNKSFIHYLTTYPLKNTFRGYIQLAPYLEPNHIALPRHRAFEIFSIDEARDARFLKRAAANDPAWPDKRFDFYFETTSNFTLVMKRDPCIHNGSIIAISRVYVLSTNREYAESIYVSPFVLRNLNADFDGDAVTVMIIRGIESTREIANCMTDSMIYDSQPRFTFSQSLIYYIFRRLCFEEKEWEEMNRSNRSEIERICSNAQHVKSYLINRLDPRRDSNAFERARRIFGPWLKFYMIAIEQLSLYRYNNDDDEDDWSKSIWHISVLDRITTLCGSNDFLTWMIRTCCAKHKQSVPIELLDETVLCLKNWLIVHSGAKSSPRDLWHLHERYESYRNANDDKLRSYDDFYKRCSADRILTYKRYMDDFVLISKNVPKTSYFASGLKWVAQTCAIANNTLTMSGRPILQNVNYYFRDIERGGY